MNSFFSSLTVNTKKISDVHQIFKPRYNKEYFKRLVKNSHGIEATIEKRCRSSPLIASNYQKFSEVQFDSRKIIELKNEYEKLDKRTDPESSSKKRNIQQKIEDLEDSLHRVVINLPNRYSKTTPDQDLVIDEVKSSFSQKQNLFKVLSHKKLSFINNCYSKSVIGPNSHYYFGIGAKLQHGLNDYFYSGLERENFIPTSGICLAKTPVVEATNHKESKDFSRDPCKVLDEQDSLINLHLVEASRESLIGFLATTELSPKNESIRLMTCGSAYRIGSDWFDTDQRSVTQFQTVHALCQTPSIEQYSMKEYNIIKNIIWSLYRDMGIPCRLVNCSLDSMLPHEYESAKVEVWLPSIHNWIPVSRISHYLDYVTIRVGSKRGHIIDSTVYDSQALVASIIENNQTNTGKFLIPEVLKNHMLCLTSQEELDYFGPPTDCNKPGKSQVLSNYEQRRYLVKRSYTFSHSQKAMHPKRSTWQKIVYGPFVIIIVIFGVFDLEEIYINLVPRPVKKFFHDKIIKFFTYSWWWLSYRKGEEWPPYPLYEEIDHSREELSLPERKKLAFSKKNKAFSYLQPGLRNELQERPEDQVTD